RHASRASALSVQKDPDAPGFYPRSSISRTGKTRLGARGSRAWRGSWRPPRRVSVPANKDVRKELKRSSKEGPRGGGVERRGPRSGNQPLVVLCTRHLAGIAPERARGLAGLLGAGSPRIGERSRQMGSAMKP